MDLARCDVVNGAGEWDNLLCLARTGAGNEHLPLTAAQFKQALLAFVVHLAQHIVEQQHRIVGQPAP
jgi:hypothetical protein